MHSRYIGSANHDLNISSVTVKRMAKTISATISHEFVVSEIVGTGAAKDLYSPVVDVVHNNIKLEFWLNLCITKSSTAVNVTYLRGPKESIQMEYQLFVIGDNGRISIKDLGTEEFKRGFRQGNLQAMPATAKEIGEMGYLTADGKVLHIIAELSIEETAFPLPIFVSLSHKFNVNDFQGRVWRTRSRNLFGVGVMHETYPDDEDEQIIERNSGPAVLVAHNGIKLSLKLSAKPAKQNNNYMRFYVDYVEGPTESIVLDLELFVVKGRKRESTMLKHNCTLSKNSETSSIPTITLPRALHELSAAGYFDLDKQSIHIIAELSIPENVFQSPVKGPPDVLVDSFSFHLFQQITTPAVTNSPTSNRFELITEDDTHLWAHKDVLSFASDVFKDLLSSSKPEETKMESLKKGEMRLKDLSGDALRQMLHFIYLRQPDKDFGSFVQEILPVADRFLMKGLKDECERCLVDQLDTMSVDGLYYCLKSSQTFNLKNLATACVQTLTMYVQQNNDIEQSRVLSLIELAKQHGYDTLGSACELNLGHKLDTADDQAWFLPLVTVGREHNLDVLINHCVQWLKKNFTQLKAGGFVDALMADNTENGRSVIQFLFERMAMLP